MPTDEITKLKRLTAGAAKASRSLAGMVAERAADEGLVDVAYGFVDSPFGRLLVATTDRGLVTLAYPHEDQDAVLDRLALRVSPRVLEWPRATDEVRRELEQYFERRRRVFDVPVDFRLTRGFTQRVLRQTARIPYGSVTTYRDVAARAGSPRAMRAAGNALGANPVPIVVPCHRVVHADGGLGGYTGGLDRKIALLSLEGSLEPASERGLAARPGRFPVGRAPRGRAGDG